MSCQRHADSLHAHLTSLESLLHEYQAERTTLHDFFAHGASPSLWEERLDDMRSLRNILDRLIQNSATDLIAYAEQLQMVGHRFTEHADAPSHLS